MSTATPGVPLVLRQDCTAQRPGGTLTKTCRVPPSCTKHTAPCCTAARPACATPSSLCHHATTSSYVASTPTVLEYTAAGLQNMITINNKSETKYNKKLNNESFSAHMFSSISLRPRSQTVFARMSSSRLRFAPAMSASVTVLNAYLSCDA